MKFVLFAYVCFVFCLPSYGQRNAAVPVKTKEKSAAEAPQRNQPVYHLEMEGLLFIGSSKAKATVTIYKDSTIFLKTESEKRSGKCSFALPLDQVFIIELSKEGYVSKKIKINTSVPEMRKRKNFEFRFEADIFESIPGLNVSVLQKPVAEVKYSEGFDSFIYDVEYTSKVNKELKKLYQDYYLLQKAGVEEETVVTPVTTGSGKEKSKKDK